MSSYLLLFIPFFSANLYAQTSVIQGTILANGKPVTDVSVGFVDLQKGSITDENGHYQIRNLPTGVHQLKVSALGYVSVTKVIKVEPNVRLTQNFNLQESIQELPQLVVTGTLRETLTKDTPVKVQVLSNQYLRKNPSSNLMGNISFINGLYEQIGCGVCGTNSVRINGMEGPYTMLLIDGMPVMGSLASIYGFDGINSSIIESVEITKGPNSTLYGSEAMGGVINIRTKQPEQSDLFTLNIFGTTHGEGNLDISYAPNTEVFSTLLSGNIFYFDDFIDNNHDGFADITQKKRFSFFNKWSFKPSANQSLTLLYKLYYEDRLGGTQDYSTQHFGSSSIYGEAVETKRLEVLGAYNFQLNNEPLRIESSYSYHDQVSYYGNYKFTATQKILYNNLIWDKKFSSRNLIIAGAAVKYDELFQLFDEQYLHAGSEDERFVPGLFAQYERLHNDAFRGLFGLRLDYFNKHGFIFSPRLNIKFDAGSHTTLRLNTGTGFRIVNIFTEQHEVLSGSRSVQIEEKLEPERSTNVTLNANQIIDIGVSVLNVDLDLFYTHFSNQIIPDYSTPNIILYSNLDGYAISRGMSISAAHNFPGPLMYSIGFTLQDVFQVNDAERQPILHAPKWTGVFSFSYTFTDINTSLDWTGRFVGRMHLPQYDGYSSSSKIFSEHNLKVSKPIGKYWMLYTSAKNIFNYTQTDPLVEPDKPFSDEFATDRVYGPLQGRRFLIGIQYQM